MDIEEEIANNSNNQESKGLNTAFVIMLCLLFYWLIRESKVDINLLFKIIIPDIAISGIQFYYLNFIWFLWVIYGFWAVIQALKGANNTIFCLKLCLPLYFISYLSRITVKGFGLRLLPLFMILYPLIFFIYICKSATIKKEYPKESRKVEVAGFIGILLYALIIFFYAQAVITGASSVFWDRTNDTAKIQLYDNEFSDGRSIFKTKSEWQLDSIVKSGYLGQAYCFHDIKNHAIIRVTCTREEYEPTRDNYIYSITEECPFGIVPHIVDFNYKQVETDDVIIYVDQYRYEANSAIYYWTYASKLGKKNDKGIRLSIVEKDNCSTEVSDVIKFMDNTTFDLRSRLLKKDGVD